MERASNPYKPGITSHSKGGRPLGNSPRRDTVVLLRALGLETHEIASTMCISKKTVLAHEQQAREAKARAEYRELQQKGLIT